MSAEGGFKLQSPSKPFWPSAKWLFELPQIKGSYWAGMSSDIPDSKSVYSVLCMTDNRPDMRTYYIECVLAEERQRANHR